MTTETLDEMIKRYGMPHTWDAYVNFVNKWRLVMEAIETRVIIDVAMHCPNAIGRHMAQGKFPDLIQLIEIDRTWPGRGDFAYNWESVDWDVVERGK